MAILSIARDWGVEPSLVRISASNTLAEVGTAGYLTAQADNIAALNAGAFDWLLSDMVLVYASDGWGFYTIDPDFTSLEAFSLSPTVIGPTVIGDFAVFASVDGNLEDLGYLPSDATKTRVVMAGSATVIGQIAKFADITGTVDDTAGVAVNLGGIYAGASGTAGVLRSYPATASRGYLQLAAANNAADHAGIITNASLGQAVTWTLADPADTTSAIVQAPSPLVDANFVAASGVAGLVADSGYGVNNILRYASVAVSAAEFNGMYAAPKLLIAAPGANQQIIVDRMELVMTYVSAAYADGGVVFAQYDSTANGAGVKATNTEAAADFFAVASNTFAFIGTSGNTVGALPFSTTVNKGLYLSNATGAFTTGDSTFVVKVHYRIIATA